MTHVNRRNFLKLIGASAATAVAPSIVRAENLGSTLNAVVVGGGFGGATAAKYLRLWGQGKINVTLIDKNAFHYSCVLSNLVLNGRLGMSNIKLTYDALQSRYGVNVLQNTVTNVDLDFVYGLNGTAIARYDRLILAPGIDFDPITFINGTEAQKKLVLHAWQAGQQTLDLKSQLTNLYNGGTYILTIPPKPYRCPPGPYERACVVADYFKRKKPNCKVIVLDANPSIVAEPHTFDTAFRTLYGNSLTYVANASLKHVAFATEGGRLKRVVTATVNGVDQVFKCDVLNVLPKMKAGAIAREPFGGALLKDAGGLNAKAWAQVDPFSYASVNADYSHIHVIGDSSGGAASTSNQPKSAHMANSQAKICADAIVRLANGLDINDPNRIANIVTNSACYSPITYDKASWLTAVYRYDETAGSMKIADYASTSQGQPPPASGVDPAFGEAPYWDGENFEAMLNKWAVNLFADCFA